MTDFQKLALIISIAVVLLIAITVLVIFIIRKKKNKVEEEFPELLVALGGEKNILDISFKGSRVSVIVEDKKIVDKEKIKQQGVETIVVSKNKVTMVVGKNSEIIFNYLNNINKTKEAV